LLHYFYVDDQEKRKGSFSMQKFSRKSYLIATALLGIGIIGSVFVLWPQVSQLLEPSLSLSIPRCVDSPQAHATVRAVASIGNPQIDEGVSNIATLQLWQSSCGIFASASLRRIPPEPREATISIEQPTIIPGLHLMRKTTSQGDHIWTPLLSRWQLFAPITACLTISLATVQSEQSSVCLTTSLV
jgi:hypothetical protein